MPNSIFDKKLNPQEMLQYVYNCLGDEAFFINDMKAHLADQSYRRDNNPKPGLVLGERQLLLNNAIANVEQLLGVSTREDSSEMAEETRLLTNLKEILQATLDNFKLSFKEIATAQGGGFQDYPQERAVTKGTYANLCTGISGPLFQRPATAEKPLMAAAAGPAREADEGSYLLAATGSRSASCRSR